MVSSEAMICANCEKTILTPDGRQRCKHDLHLCDRASFSVVDTYLYKPQVKKVRRKKVKN